MKANGENLIFETTGRETGGNCGFIGLNQKGEVSGGYDQILFDEWDSKPLTPEERAELSDFMVEQWKKFKQQPK